MSMTRSELRTQLGVIETDDSMYAPLGPDDVEALKALLDEEEGWLAARAVHALSRIDTQAATEAVLEASTSERMEVRTAAAVAASRLPSDLADSVLVTLLQDPAASVRKVAVTSVTTRNSERVLDEITRIARADPNQALRKLTSRKQRELGRGEPGPTDR